MTFYYINLQNSKDDEMGGKSGKLSINNTDPSSPHAFTFKISIKTGDRPKAGTDANVYIVLHGNGQASPETKLDVFFRNDFERGQLDSFQINKLPVRIFSLSLPLALL